MGQPGEKIDLSTFIAYLLPGFIVLVLGLTVADSIYLILNRVSILPMIVALEVSRLLAIGAVVVVVGYFIGLIIDLYAHSFTEKYEEDRKNEAYKDVIERLQYIVKGSHRDFLKSDDLSAIKRRNTFIDAMFYHYATPSQWSRQNWSWAFYEAARDLVILFIPSVFILLFYAAIVVMVMIRADVFFNLLVSSIFAIVVTGLAWRFPYRKAKDYRDTICRVYHRHRAYVVLGTLINRVITDSENPARD